MQTLVNKKSGESLDEIVVALWLDDAKTQPMDLSGFTAKMQFREFPSGTTMIDYRMDDGSLTIAGNEITCKAVLAGISRAGTYRADLFLTEPGGVSQVINTYQITIEDAYTR